MNIFVNLKSIGKRKKGLEKISYTIPDGINTLRGLIDAVVRQETAAYNRRLQGSGVPARNFNFVSGSGSYNARGTDNMLINFLTEEKIEDKSTAGKVGFGRLYSENKADSEKASAVAIQGFEDGLFRALVNDTEHTELDMPLAVQDGDVLTFIRLTFLAGRLW